MMIFMIKYGCEGIPGEFEDYKVICISSPLLINLLTSCGRTIKGQIRTRQKTTAALRCLTSIMLHLTNIDNAAGFQ